MNDFNENDDERNRRLEYLMDLELPQALSADQRLLLAILRQAVIDYFGDDPIEQLDAALYFADSRVYQATLQLFGLPDDLLPHGVDLTNFRRKKMNNQSKPDGLQLEALVRRLSGTQLKIVLTMGLLPLPVATRKISLQCGLSRSTTLVALDQMADQGLIMRHQVSGRVVWSFPEEVRRLVAEVWSN
ncbi:MAG: hypothetical protein KJ046_12045 [Anaerolineae bacterium]|nr:hypothetical protein [Anaerolineae bacterium]RIK18304.1 MAG: hypothetical protein DCC51_10870 [Anaerolineae bacterium]